METKKCPRCLQEKLLTEYQKNKASKDGLQFHCKYGYLTKHGSKSD